MCMLNCSCVQYIGTYVMYTISYMCVCVCVGGGGGGGGVKSYPLTYRWSRNSNVSFFSLQQTDRHYNEIYCMTAEVAEQYYTRTLVLESKSVYL